VGALDPIATEVPGAIDPVGAAAVHATRRTATSAISAGTRAEDLRIEALPNPSGVILGCILGSRMLSHGTGTGVRITQLNFLDANEIGVKRRSAMGVDARGPIQELLRICDERPRLNQCQGT
jgi:hypothetical protein